MRKFKRTQTPDFLKDKWKSFGDLYIKNRERKPNFKFYWNKIGKKPLNQLLLPLLKAMTDNHCSYCDGFPLGRADDQIDHFCAKSKTEFYPIAYQWENLYIACADCQGQSGKGEQYDEKLLRPDGTDYSFEKYFYYDFIEHKVLIKENIEEDLRAQAEITLRIFNFNHESLPVARRHSYERFYAQENAVLNDFAYRFLFE
jgi:uncharacterized protein (TIGR02646 family)